MLTWFLRRRIAAFEREFDYDMSYARELLDSDPAALVAFSKVLALGKYRKGAPLDAVYAAKLATVMAEDCGPCTQLVVTMAEREGVSAEVLRAIIARDVGRMPENAGLAFRFAEATLAHDSLADALREQVVQRWGKRGLVSLAFAITSGRIFPTLKYAVGLGQACTRVKVAGMAVTVGPMQEIS